MSHFSSFLYLYLVSVALLCVPISSSMSLDGMSPGTQLDLARRFRDTGSVADTKKAVALYQNIIDTTNTKEHADALYELSMIFEKTADDNYMSSLHHLFSDSVAQGAPRNVFNRGNSTASSSQKPPSKHTHPYDYVFELLMRAAEAGHPDAQHELAAAYNTGIHSGLVPVDVARSLLLEYMAALSGNAEAHMGMGFRYAQGLGVKPSCERALLHYEYAANEVVRQIGTTAAVDGDVMRSGRAGQLHDQRRWYRGSSGQPVHLEASKLSDTYMFGSGNNGGKAAGKQQEFDRSLLDFYKQLSDEGDMNAAYNLGLIYYYGTRLVDADMQLALYYLYRAASNGATRGKLGGGTGAGENERGGASNGAGGDHGEDDDEGAPGSGAAEEDGVAPSAAKKKNPTPVLPLALKSLGAVNNASVVGDATRSPHVIQARGLLGYILAKGEYFARPMGSPGGASSGDLSDNNGDSGSSAQAPLYYPVLQVSADVHITVQDMVSMLRFGVHKNDANAIAGVAFLMMQGTLEGAVLQGPGPMMGAGAGRAKEGFRLSKNATRAFELFQLVSNRQPDAGYYMGELLLRKVRMVEVKTVMPGSGSGRSGRGGSKKNKVTSTITTTSGTRRKKVSRRIDQAEYDDGEDDSEDVVDLTDPDEGFEGLVEVQQEVTGSVRNHARKAGRKTRSASERLDDYDYTPDEGSMTGDSWDDEDEDIDDVMEGNDMRRVFRHMLREEEVVGRAQLGSQRSIDDSSHGAMTTSPPTNAELNKKFRLMQLQQRQKQSAALQYNSEIAMRSGGADSNALVPGVMSSVPDRTSVYHPKKKTRDMKIIRKLKKYKVHPASVSDAAAALMAYASSSQRGHVQATHRVGHMVARGIGTEKNCGAALNAFKTVAERGDWNYELIIASIFVDEGKFAAALRIYNKFAMMGYESAQVNAAYIITNLYCPSWLAPPDAEFEAQNAQATGDGGSESVDGDSITSSRSRSGGAKGLTAVVHTTPKSAQSVLDDMSDDAPAVLEQEVKKTSRDAKKAVALLPAPASVALIPYYKWSMQQEQHIKHKATIIPAPSAIKGADTDGDSPDSARGPHGISVTAAGFESSIVPASSNASSWSGWWNSLTGNVNGTDGPHAHRYSRSDCEARAITLYSQSAMQGSGESYTKIGDNFYFGLGWLDADEKVALEFYKFAATLRHTNAIFSVGMMHEFGEGVAQQDFYLAKRFYDQAATTDPGAALPSQIANRILVAHEQLQQLLGPNVTEPTIRYIRTAFKQSLHLVHEAMYLCNHIRNMLLYTLPRWGVQALREYTMLPVMMETAARASVMLEWQVQRGERMYQDFLRQSGLTQSGTGSAGTSMTTDSGTAASPGGWSGDQAVGRSKGSLEGAVSVVLETLTHFDTILIFVLVGVLWYLSGMMKRRRERMQAQVQGEAEAQGEGVPEGEDAPQQQPVAQVEEVVGAEAAAETPDVAAAEAAAAVEQVHE